MTIDFALLLIGKISGFDKVVKLGWGLWPLKKNLNLHQKWNQHKCCRNEDLRNSSKYSFTAINKAIISDQLGEVSSRFLHTSWSVRVIEIHIVQSKLFTVSRTPFEVIQKRPGSVRNDVATIKFLSCLKKKYGIIMPLLGHVSKQC